MTHNEEADSMTEAKKPVAKDVTATIKRLGKGRPGFRDCLLAIAQTQAEVLRALKTDGCSQEDLEHVMRWLLRNALLHMDAEGVLPRSFYAPKQEQPIT